jgi:hypothetical protein
VADESPVTDESGLARRILVQKRSSLARVVLAALLVVLTSMAVVTAATAGGATAASGGTKAGKVKTSPSPSPSPTASPTPTSSPTPSPTTSPTPTATPAPAPSSRSFGVTMDQVPGTMAPLQTLADQLGRRPDRVMWYAAWSTGAGFPTQAATAVAQFGATPVITWEPWDPSQGTSQPAYALSRIASGAFDAYLTSWAQQARSYGGPVVIRFAHEMNGSWYPWAPGVNGGTAASYVAAWRHVVDVFRAQGATNVTWQWSPNVPYPGSTDLASVYPGDDYVDSVALDGYNWAGVTAGAAWTSFADVFAAGVAQVRAVTQEPLFVAETATAEEGGAKATWISDMFAALEGSGTIAGFTWFDFDKEGDWRIDSSADALAVFRSGLLGY